MQPHAKIRHAHNLMQLAASLLDEAAREYAAEYAAAVEDSHTNKESHDWLNHNAVERLDALTRRTADELLHMLGRGNAAPLGNDLARLQSMAEAHAEGAALTAAVKLAVG